MTVMDRTSALELLGMPEGSDLPSIRKAWRALVRTYHPDQAKLDPEVANARLAEINAAYDLLLLSNEDTPRESVRRETKDALRARQARVRREKDARRHARSASWTAAEHTKQTHTAQAKPEQTAFVAPGIAFDRRLTNRALAGFAEAHRMLSPAPDAYADRHYS